MKRRVLVCGGREYSDNHTLYNELDALHEEMPISVIIHGDARGADHLADAWAISRGINTEPYPADWVKHGKAAGPIRNSEMLKEGKPDLVVAFPGNFGTDDMVRQAKAVGVSILDLRS